MRQCLQLSFFPDTLKRSDRTEKALQKKHDHELINMACKVVQDEGNRILAEGPEKASVEASADTAKEQLEDELPAARESSAS